MKKTINLYPKELVPQIEVLNVTLILILMGLTAITFWGIDNHYSAQVIRLQNNIAALDSEITRKQSVLELIKNELANRTEDPLLIAETNAKEGKLKEKIRLVRAIRERDTLKTQSFANLLGALASKPHKGLWLTEIKAEGQELVFGGRAIQPEAVPEWLSSLSDTEFFSGRTFNETRIERDDETLKFLLSSKTDGENNDG